MTRRRDKMRTAAALPFALAVLVSGCGYVGDTKPPTLDIPSRVIDLRAAEYGSSIAIEFTLPRLTTEGLELKSVRSVEARVTGGGQDRVYPISSGAPGLISDDIPAQDWTGRSVTITVRATGPKGKTSEWSNAVTLPIEPPLASPVNVEATSAPEGVQLTWSGPGPAYRVFRAAGDGKPERLAESSMPAYTDASAAFGSRYRYLIQTLDGELRQSEISRAAEITPKDEFPPAVPTGVSAVAAVDSIELSWERNTEDDFSGYDVYRSAANAAFEKIAGAINTPVYSDRTVEAGKRYRYAITAIDAIGNESARSAAVEALAQ